MTWPVTNAVAATTARDLGGVLLSAVLVGCGSASSAGPGASGDAVSTASPAICRVLEPVEFPFHRPGELPPDFVPSSRCVAGVTQPGPMLYQKWTRGSETVLFNQWRWGTWPIEPGRTMERRTPCPSGASSCPSRGPLYVGFSGESRTIGPYDTLVQHGTQFGEHYYIMWRDGDTGLYVQWLSPRSEEQVFHFVATVPPIVH